MLKTTQNILDSPATHYLTRNIIREALERDTIDAYFDIMAAATAIRAEMDSLLED